MNPQPETLVQPDRVHRRCYSDPGLFDLELINIFERTWVYCGHESQLANAGDFVRVQIGRQPMLMVRDECGAIQVLYNSCPHRGAQLCVRREGSVGREFICSYHGWRFDLGGRLTGVPIADGYRGTGMSPDNPAFSMKRAARVESYRGFVFARLVEQGPSLVEWLGGGRAAFDDMCDRSPEGEVEIVPVCHRVLQKSNWKLFMENQVDVLHAGITHESTGRAAMAVEQQRQKETGAAPAEYKFLSTLALPLGRFAEMLESRNFPHGHSVIAAYLERPDDPEALEYERMMRDRYGAAKAEEILSRNVHHVVLYPCVSVQPPLLQLRVIRPLALDVTLSELWHFRLKGAPESMYRYPLGYFNLINSPSTMVNADDLENWSRCQRGVVAAGEWISLHRGCGSEESAEGGVIGKGGSEAPLRNQYQAWLKYMNGGEAA
jgi:phenylpropionate dioxygenase-like ring-hydroxylating dioxygenase large terminal subunit